MHPLKSITNKKKTEINVYPFWKTININRKARATSTNHLTLLSKTNCFPI